MTTPIETQCPSCLADTGEPCDFEARPSLGSDDFHLTRHGRAASIRDGLRVNSDVVPFDVSQRPKLRERVQKMQRAGRES